jgi:hypothetical protein
MLLPSYGVDVLGIEQERAPIRLDVRSTFLASGESHGASLGVG